MPRAWNLIKQDLDPVIRNKPPVSRYIAYGGRNWFPDENSKSLFDPAWTNQFEYDDDDTNNNYSEAYNSRMKKIYGGDHPNLYKAIAGTVEVIRPLFLEL
jgi:hypothetical protein